MTELAQKLNTSTIGGDIAVKEIHAPAREMAREGIVLLKNEGCLPIKEGDRVSVLGRCAVNYFTVGYGSGGDVAAPYRASLMDGLKAARVNYNRALAGAYEKWCALPENAPGEYEWGKWPMSLNEMPLDDAMVKAAANESDLALVVIGRAAGEDRENRLEKGSYYLTDAEEEMLFLCEKHFGRVCAILDCGNIIDMSWTERHPGVSAIVYAWQGGMESGYALCDILTGVCPSGRLADTIAKKYEDYPGCNDFGKDDYNNYTEDIYVGYRYFETFCPEKVLYPFGFGLSYTKFKQRYACERNGDEISVKSEVLNAGTVSGKQVVQVYLELPEGSLGNPKRVLAGFKKTRTLAPGEGETLLVTFNLKELAPFDEESHSSVLEAGGYAVCAGENVRDAQTVLTFNIEETRIIKTFEELSAVQPECAFERMVNRGGKLAYAPVPTAKKNLKAQILKNLPKAEEYAAQDYNFNDILEGKCSVKEFVRGLSVEELDSLTRGEGEMDSPLGVKGNAGALGGVSEKLRARGIPHAITTDGPSGLRISATASLLPCGTALACSFNPEGVEALYGLLGREMLCRGSDMQLGPGMNIHRNPLCGRNFEYYSEDPLLTGKTAAATIRGIQLSGKSACPKHFACNNQEQNRNYNDSRVSERALREIYLKGFEIAVKEGKPLAIMTSYNKINGVWSHYSYPLASQLLRQEWGYEGLVVTDWWMRRAASPEFPCLKDDAYRVRARVDVLMPGFINGREDPGISAIPEALNAPDGLTIEELRLCAEDVIRFLVAIR